jgi:5-methylcytosine-specific restriction endonuclease McrA
VGRAQLLAQFHEAMLGIYDAARRLKPPYVPGDFRRMVVEMGGKATADKLLAMDKPSDGFGTLLLRGKEALKLSVEYVVLQHPWRQLFEPEQLAIARRRLQEVRCELPPEDVDTPSEPEDGEEAGSIEVPGDGTDRVIYFNNCKNRDHKGLFGRGAFYDLNLTGIQATQAVGLQPGQECVVATTAPDNRVIFTWYSFLRERRLRERGSADRTLCRVFFGDPLLAETFSKEDAATNPRYRAFFNVKGHFKQQSTISAMVPHGQRPTDPPADSSEIRDLRRELRELQRPDRPKTPEMLRRVQRILRSYEGPSAITRYVKRMRGSTCQLCEDPGFVMRNGQRYCEAHHLFHLSKNPPPECLGPEYLVILCATCHRRMHYADVGEPVRDRGGWRVRVDDKEMVFRI